MPADSMIRRFLRDTCGAALLEFTIVAWFFFAVVFGIVEIGYFMWQFSAASKGAQTALRYAVVTDPVPRTSATLLPGSTVTITCRMSSSGLSTTCNSGAANHQAMACIAARMQRFAPFVAPDNIVLDYRSNGIGIGGVIAPTIELRLEDIEFTSVFLRFLGGQMLPPLRFTMIAEDMNSRSPGSNPDTNTTQCGNNT